MRVLALGVVLLISDALKAEAVGEKEREEGTVLDARGRLEFEAGRYLNAKKYFVRALELQAANGQPETTTLTNAGQACMALGESKQAEAYFRRAIEHMPEVATLWHRLGQALYLQNRREEAEAAYRRALRDHGNADVRNDLAAALLARNRREESVELLREAVAVCPIGQNRARILRNLGVLEWKLGARDAAVTHLRQALEETEVTVGVNHPDVAQVLQDYSEVLAKIGEKSRSREAAKRAESIRSSFAGSYGRHAVDWRELRK